MALIFPLREIQSLWMFPKGECSQYASNRGHSPGFFLGLSAVVLNPLARKSIAGLKEYYGKQEDNGTYQQR